MFFTLESLWCVHASFHALLAKRRRCPVRLSLSQTWEDVAGAYGGITFGYNLVKFFNADPSDEPAGFDAELMQVTQNALCFRFAGDDDLWVKTADGAGWLLRARDCYGHDYDTPIVLFAEMLYQSFCA